MTTLVDELTAIKNVSLVGQTFNLLGILVNNPRIKTGRGDNILDLTIQDEAVPQLLGNASSIALRILRRRIDDFPNINGPGDVVLAQNVKLQTIDSKRTVVAHMQSAASVFVFPLDGIPKADVKDLYSIGAYKLPKLSYKFGSHTNPASETISPPVQVKIIELGAAALQFKSQIDQFAFRTPAPAGQPPIPFASLPATAGVSRQAPPRTLPNCPNTAGIPSQATTNIAHSIPPRKPKWKPKHRRLRELEANKFYDLSGEVVKKVPSDMRSLELHITDYTENSQLYPNMEDNPRPGPVGQMTLLVKVWEPHAGYIYENIEEQDFVLLQNVQTKYSPVGFLEGALRTDRYYPDKVCVRKLDQQDQIDEINDLKTAYFTRRRGQDTSAVANEPKKPSAKAAAKKKEVKREQQRVQRELEQRELEQQLEAKIVAGAGLNPHIKAEFSDIRLSTVSEIIKNPALKRTHPSGNVTVLPFVNAKYRTRVRVVDFSPGFLQQFTRSMADCNWNTALQSVEPNDRKRDDRWEWAFVLLVEDINVPAGATPERLRLFVTGQDAEKLLGGLKAVDLGANTETVVKLEERLFILWGNLLELKESFRGSSKTLPLPSGDQMLQNTPFECCIEEYGKKLPSPNSAHPQGWQRTHRIFGTQILDADPTSS
ncbi:hypothetical protein BCR34DRAFT_591641 [Clohesyomyces aquaticus]|uniref:Protection of telomeres protein 1 ssDNA-binding domain-containing protein n=1 Tax=Clohesyomyces aquaticus TaxID=1231657 RepID=A0A1Y1YZB7_9PLEO|nr:hypothetical protein BCR34DRAFT_591641 [Clohesyomyces aquaticus]